MWKMVPAFVVFAMAFVASAAINVSFDSMSKDSATDKPVIVSGLLFEPEGAGPHPAVVLLHTCGGPKYHTTSYWLSFLTRLGYVVLSVDSSGPRKISRCNQFDYDLWRTVQAFDALGALDYLASQPFIDAENVAVIGFSTGAVNINNVIVADRAISPEGRRFKAAVAFYGTCWKISHRSDNDIPVLEIVGEHDRLHVGTCMDAGGFEGIDTYVIKGTHHAFDQPEFRNPAYDTVGSLMQYSGSATKKAGEVTKAFLAHNLRGLPTAKIWKEKSIKGSEETRSDLDDWLAVNRQLCSRDADYFSKGVNSHIRKLKSDNQIIPAFMVSKFKMRRLYEEHCS